MLLFQRETQDSKTFAKTANSDQDLNMTRHALDKSQGMWGGLDPSLSLDKN